MSGPTNVAFVEEAGEDTGSSLEGVAGTRVYAYSETPTTPPKEQPNTGKSRSEQRPSLGRKGESSANNSDSTTRSAKKERVEARRDKDVRPYMEQEREERERELERRRDERREKETRRMKAEERADKESSKALKKIRPTSLKHSATQPVVQQAGGYRRGHIDEPSYYGTPQPAASGTRPRATTRPASYYAGQTRPPPPNAGWQQPSMPPPPFHPGSFPPPGMFPGGPPPGMHGGRPPQSPTGPPPPGYYDPGPPPGGHHSRDLRHRFDRPSSAMDLQSPASRSYRPDDHYEYAGEPVHVPKRTPRNRKQQQEDDRKRMPPPDFKPMRNMPRRPSTTAPTSTAFQPPPQRPASRHGQTHTPARSSHRRSVGFTDQPGYDDDDFLGDDDLFHDISPEPSYNQRRRSGARARRESLIYDDDDYEVMPATGRRSRRASMYGSAALGSGGVSLEGEDKYLHALKYQEDVSGGPQVPLTAESLRKASKRGGGVASSRSTRSSASRDESEHKRSYTTGITRSSSGGNDDFTIKISGAALLRVNGAEIECEDSEITFNNPAGISRGGSDHASTAYQIEDSRNRFERKALPHRARAPSQSDSQSRGYAPTHAPYDPPYGNYI